MLFEMIKATKFKSNNKKLLNWKDLHKALVKLENVKKTKTSKKA